MLGFWNLALGLGLASALWVRRSEPLLSDAFGLTFSGSCFCWAEGRLNDRSKKVEVLPAS